MNEDIFEEAASWHAQQDRNDMDWDEFAAWLEADPRHRVAFDDVALLEERIDRHCDSLREILLPPRHFTAAELSVPPHRTAARWGWPAAAAAAAAVMLVAGAVTLRHARQEGSSIEYRATLATRTIDLGGGAHASLAPGSVLVADTADPRRLTLSGRALFRVAHDPGRELVVRAEGYEIRDVGTRFDVVTGAGQMRIAVAEGRVAVRTPSGGPEVEVGAGRSLTGYANGRVTTAKGGPKDVGGWQAGPLVYERVPLGIVAADVSRASGRTVEVDAALRPRPFSGVLVPARGDAMADALAASAGLQARRDGETIRMGDGAPR